MTVEKAIASGACALACATCGFFNIWRSLAKFDCQEAYLEAPSQKRNEKEIMLRREICWKWLVPAATRVYR